MNYYNETDKYIFFWHGPFSNFWKTKIKIKDLEFLSSEQAFMYMKAKVFDKSKCNKILETDSPQEAKKIGRKIRNYDDLKWASLRYDVMKDILFYKFSQNPELKIILLKTGNKILVEGSPYDKIWGVGIHFKDELIYNESNWRGQNLLGKALMEVREKLK